MNQINLHSFIYCQMSVVRVLRNQTICKWGARSFAARSGVKSDQATHTGQQFEEGDQRNARFDITGYEKLVNNKWAIDLIKEVPPIKVNKRVVIIF